MVEFELFVWLGDCVIVGTVIVSNRLIMNVFILVF